MKVIKNKTVIYSLIFSFMITMFGQGIMLNGVFFYAYASSFNEEICKANGGNIKNTGIALEDDSLDYCMNLELQICSEINGIWNECVEPDCSDINKPCPTVLCIAEDVCALYDNELSQEKIQMQEIQSQIMILIVICVIIAIVLAYIFVRKKRINNLQS